MAGVVGVYRVCVCGSAWRRDGFLVGYVCIYS